MTAKQALNNAKARDRNATAFIVRHYDGFDGDWIDISEPVSEEEAMKIWNEKTDNGTRLTRYSNIDYYAIFPSTVKMIWSEEGLGSQFR